MVRFVFDVVSVLWENEERAERFSQGLCVFIRVTDRDLQYQPPGTMWYDLLRPDDLVLGRVVWIENGKDVLSPIKMRAAAFYDIWFLRRYIKVSFI